MPRLRTRWTPAALVLVPLPRANGRNSNPDIARAGSRSQRRTSHPESGKATRYVAPSAATRRREVEDSPTTSRRATRRHSHPRSLAIPGASRVFRSSACMVACESGITDLTSTTSTVAVSTCRANTSMDPRSPHFEKETSTAASQPSACRHRTVSSTRPACARSSSRSMASPRHRSRTSRSASSATAMRDRLPTETSPTRPRSTRETSSRDTPAAAARSSWRQLRRIRRARTDEPTRTASIGEMMARGTSLAVIATLARHGHRQRASRASRERAAASELTLIPHWRSPSPSGQSATRAPPETATCWPDDEAVQPPTRPQGPVVDRQTDRQGQERERVVGQDRDRAALGQDREQVRVPREGLRPM